MSKIKIDTYKISRTDFNELLEAYSDNKESALNACIDICRERARLYVVPCQWDAFPQMDGSVIVKRYRNS